MSYEKLFLVYLFMTIIIETTLLLVMKKRFLPEYTIQNLIVMGIVCTGLTLPHVWFVFPDFISGV